MATRKRAQHTSDGRNSSDGTSHGQAKRGRVVLDKGKARASIEGLEIQNAREMAKERAKDTHIPPSCAASDSGAVQTTSKPEGTIDTSLSMEMDEDDVNLAADRSTQSWMMDSPSLLSSSLSLSSAESRSPFQNRMPPPPVSLQSCWQRKQMGIRGGGFLLVSVDREPLDPRPRLWFWCRRKYGFKNGAQIASSVAEPSNEAFGAHHLAFQLVFIFVRPTNEG